MEFMNGGGELIPVPGLNNDSAKLAAEFSEYLEKSRKKTFFGVFFRMFLPVIFRSSALLYYSRKIYTFSLVAMLLSTFLPWRAPSRRRGGFHDMHSNQ